MPLLKTLPSRLVFLLTLATAARVSKPHALSTAPVGLVKRTDGSIDLVTDPGFIAKYRLPSVGAQSINLLPIKKIDKARIASLQCPVRALKIYLARTKDLRGDRTRLFLPIDQDRQDISAQPISSWIRQVIRGAYDDLSTGGSSRIRIKAHEVRAVATSVALARNCAVKDIIASVAWRSDSVFARFYLRDMKGQQAELDRLGTVAAAQHLLPAGKSSSG